MPLTLNVGLLKEINVPDGSLAVSCHMEVHVDVASLNDVDTFDRQIEEAFYICRDAVDGELRRSGEGTYPQPLLSIRNATPRRGTSSPIEVDLREGVRDQPPTRHV